MQRACLFDTEEVFKAHSLSVYYKEGVWKPKPRTGAGDHRFPVEGEDPDDANKDGEYYDIGSGFASDKDHDSIPYKRYFARAMPLAPSPLLPPGSDPDEVPTGDHLEKSGAFLIERI